jgi:hypothetical protein
MHKMSFLGIILFLFAIIIITTDSFVINSNYRSLILDVSTNQLYSNSTVSFTCSASDFGVPQYFTLTEAGNSSRIHNVSITCNSPVISYSYRVVEYVPRDGYLKKNRYCKVYDIAKYAPDDDYLAALNLTDNRDYNTTRNSLDSYHRFSIQSKKSNRLRGLFSTRELLTPLLQDSPTFRGIRYPNDDRIPWRSPAEQRRIQAQKNKFGVQGGYLGDTGLGLAVGVSFLFPIGGPAAGLFICAMMNCMQGQGDTCDNCRNELNALHAAQDQVKDTLKNYTGLVNTLAMNMSSYAELTEDRFKQSTTIVQGLQNQVNLGNQQAALRSQLQEQINAMYVAKLNEMNAHIANQDQQLYNVASLVGDAVTALNDSNTQALVGVYQFLNYLNQSNYQMADNLADTRSYTSERFRKIALLLRTNNAVIRAIALDSETKRMMTRMVQIAIGNITSGADFIPFLGDLGRAPASYLGKYSSILIDAQRLFFVKSVLGSPNLVVVELQLHCDTVRLVGTPIDKLSWRDILEEQTGPQVL